MKVSLKVLSTTIIGGLVTVAAVTGLSGCGSSKETIKIQFVPSRDPTVLAASAKTLEPILEKYAPNYSFDISTGETYAATTTALVNDQIDAGFLTASGYAQATVEYPNKVNVLLTAIRAGYKVQSDDFPGFTDDAKTKQVAAMNGEIGADGKAVSATNAAYSYLGQQSATKVSYYSSILVTCRDSYRATLNLPALDSNADGKVELTEMLGKTVARQGETSGAGYLYPSKYLYDKGYTMVDTLTNPAKQIRGLLTTGYDAAFADLMAGTVDGFWGYMDVRYSVGYNKSGNDWYQKNELFSKDTYTVAITDPIFNDTISVYSGLSTAKQDAIKAAFKGAVADGDVNTAGTGANIIYNIYSHSGYSDAKDSDYDSERAMYTWKTTVLNA